MVSRSRDESVAQPPCLAANIPEPEERTLHIQSLRLHALDISLQNENLSSEVRNVLESARRDIWQKVSSVDEFLPPYLEDERPPYSEDEYD